MPKPAFPLFDSGFNRVGSIHFNGEAVVVTFEREITYGPDDHLVLGLYKLKQLISQETLEVNS